MDNPDIKKLLPNSERDTEKPSEKTDKLEKKDRPSEIQLTSPLSTTDGDLNICVTYMDIKPPVQSFQQPQMQIQSLPPALLLVHYPVAASPMQFVPTLSEDVTTSNT